MSQTVIRSFTHYAEEKEFTSSEDFVLPQDTVGFIYNTEGGKGIDGAKSIETANLLEIRSVPCAWDYQPDTAGTTCIACPAPTWKQYRDGDCSLFTCPTGQKANAAGNGCEQIVCPSGQHLEGNSCVVDVPPKGCNFAWIQYECKRVGYASHICNNTNVNSMLSDCKYILRSYGYVPDIGTLYHWLVSDGH